MNNTPKYNIRELAERWMRGDLNAEEEAYLREWYNAFDDTEVTLKDVNYRHAEELKSHIYQKLMYRIKQDGKPKHTYKKTILISSGVILSLIAIFIWIFPIKNSPISDPQLTQDIAPGGNKAYISLPDGKQINLSSTQEGIILSDGKLCYTNGTPVEDLESSLAELDPAPDQVIRIGTPYGGQYKVVLPDGSKVWLNSGSTLEYPLNFDPESREVHFEGEGYFEIKRLAKTGNAHENIPFIVRMDQQIIQVLGTTFNIKGYKDEDEVSTTLLHGSVEVTPTGSGMSLSGTILKPNEKAILKGKSIEVNTVNAANEIAWKNGTFLFEESNLSDILHQLQRWYNVDVNYKAIPDLHFTGAIDRNQPLSKVLEMLELTGGIKFNIQHSSIDFQTLEPITN